MPARRRTQPRRPSHRPDRAGTLPLWTAILLTVAWASQGVPLLTHLSNHQPNPAPHASPTQQHLPSDQLHAAVADAEGGRPQHNPLDCHTCKTLLLAGAWAVPHVPHPEFLARLPILVPTTATRELVISFEFRTPAAPRGPPSLTI